MAATVTSGLHMMPCSGCMHFGSLEARVKTRQSNQPGLSHQLQCALSRNKKGRDFSLPSASTGGRNYFFISSFFSAVTFLALCGFFACLVGLAVSLLAGSAVAAAAGAAVSAANALTESAAKATAIREESNLFIG